MSWPSWSGTDRSNLTLLRDLLLAAPQLRAVGVDQAGVPVTVGTQVQRPGRGDPVAVREALLRLTTSPVGAPQPRHPDDHPPAAGGAPLAATALPAGEDAERCRPQLLTGEHPVGTPGPYRFPTWLRRLLSVRRPLCEWPGCGARAVRCDMDHDLAWPYGPTCACNTGPACRRHHQIKQLGWTKQRTRDAGVRWTSPTGRAWTSPAPHDPPAIPSRPLPPLPGPADPLDQLSRLGHDDELRHNDPNSPLFDDHDGLELRTEDTEPEADDHDPLENQLLHSDTRWSLDLDNPYGWADLPVSAAEETATWRGDWR